MSWAGLWTLPFQVDPEEAGCPSSDRQEVVTFLLSLGWGDRDTGRWPVWAPGPGTARRAGRRGQSFWEAHVQAGLRAAWPRPPRPHW